MDALSRSAQSSASTADLGSTQGAAALMVLKKSMTADASTAAALIDALPQPPKPAAVGTLGGVIDTYA